MEKKIFICFLFAALLITAGCRKDDTPAEVKTPVGFRAMSQAALVKSGATESLSKYHQDFGVWGIATEAINLPYILWNESTFEKVEQISSSDNYAPVTDAYWLTGYTYKFLALAPYESGVSALSINKNLAANNQSANPSISFTYDMSEKYNPTTQDQTPNYAFDLLGAAAVTPVTATKPDHQQLVFWHLFSKICIKVNFVNATGSVDEIRLSNVVTKGDYVVSLDEENDVDKPLSVTCTSSDAEADKISASSPLTLDSANKDNVTTPQWTLHIIPQVVSDFDMYIDFTVGGSSVENFKVNLSAAGTAPYTYNGSYNWILNITPKDITFDVEIVPWVDDNTGDTDFDFE